MLSGVNYYTALTVEVRQNTNLKLVFRDFAFSGGQGAPDNWAIYDHDQLKPSAFTVSGKDHCRTKDHNINRPADLYHF